ncbi:MAG: phage holin family protein [Bacteroidia bacterium]|jgi:hypothetical protein|nr:phage holin family protein [Bacteroidia bacterium]
MQQHTWSFSTVGGVKRVNLESGSDLLNLEHLDQKLWTALSCPVNNLEIDPKTLALIDLDHDGQIRVPEVLAAVKWILGILNNADDLLKQADVFPLSAVNTETETGRTLLASARVILKNLGKGDADALTVEETSDTTNIFAASRFNGDGVITAKTVETEMLQTILADIINCVGSTTDRSGEQGLDSEKLNLFIEAATAYQKWYHKAEQDHLILPFGARTEEAYLNYTALQGKIDDYFIRCRLAAFDEQTTDALNLSVERVLAISAKDLSVALDEIAAYPIAKIAAGKPLPLLKGINPAWESQMQLFESLIGKQVFAGKQEITEADWKSLVQLFAPYVQWKAEKEGAIVEILGPERVIELCNPNIHQTLFDLIEQDKALETEANNIILVDQLVRYYRDLYTLLKNFVTFYDFYSPQHKAIFQAGTLYIDQRSCNLCIKVTDMPKHSTMASYSGMFLMYCECTSRATNEKMMVVAALTNGDIDNLVVGRNALFYDRKGHDWDATVVKIIDNPISIRQAFWSPYRKVSRFIETQVNKFAAEQDSKVTADATKNIEDAQGKITAAPVNEPPKPPAQPFDVGKFVGIFAAISLALGALGTAVASVVSGFMALAWWKMPLAVAGIMLLISGPAMIMAYLKLRKRNLAPLLDANGWAINARATVNIHFGNLLTHLASLPAGAKINLNDPFTKKKRPLWPIMVALVLLVMGLYYLLWKLGYVHL